MSDRLLVSNYEAWLEEWRKRLLSLVAEQAEDEGLWFVARTAPEAYLQQELRRLHALIEKTTLVVSDE